MRTNIFVPKSPAVLTHEGAKASKITPIQQLIRSVMANMLFEGTFYEDGTAIADRIAAEVLTVLKSPNGAAAVRDIASFARNEMKLRHVPLLLVATLAKANTPATREVLADAIYGAVQRPDELGELVSLFWSDGKKMLPNQMKKGLAMAFSKFDEYALAKYDSSSAAIKLRDVLFLIHAKPKDAVQEDLWKRLIDSKLTVPDTWETQLSSGKDKGETFTRLMAEGKLGALALLRNLRNMIEARVSLDAIRSALTTMKTERVLPFRFITAARFAAVLEPELEAAMFKCLQEHSKLPGKTVLVVDNSGSMYHAVSAKSDLTRADAAAGLAMLLREICETVEVVVFSNNPVTVPARRGFALREVIQKATSHGGTDTARALKSISSGYERMILITDEQSATPIPANIWKYGYIINVACYQNGIGYEDYVKINGWSEAVVDYIQAFEKKF